MRVNFKTGLLEPVRFIFSPNFNHRPENSMIDMIVIHNISLPPGKFGGAEVIELFTNQTSIKDLQNLRVSAHIFIRRDGEIIQFVPFHLRAFHAGISCFEGRENCNDFSIGIELEGTDTELYTDIQYKNLNKVIKLLKQSYSAITPERIVGHADIAPGRKTDPGASFRWALIKKI